MKVLVFDSGWGGELFAKQLEQEIPVIDVVRMIDWQTGTYAKLSDQEILEQTALNLERAVGRFDLIVVASFTISAVALGALKQRFPEQEFMGFRPNVPKRLQKLNGGNVVVLASSIVKNTNEYKKAIKQMKNVTVIEPEIADEWIERIDRDELENEEIFRELGQYDPDAIVCFETAFSDIKKSVEQCFGWRTVFYDQLKEEIDGISKILNTRF